jgi:DNA-binding NtrC family response regulator
MSPAAAMKNTKALALVGPTPATVGLVAGLPAGARDAAPVFVTACPLMQEVLSQAGRVAASNVGVLIEGESGTGKELVARLIHSASPRADQPYVRVNCAALSEGLVESELFGHERGAFTGADDTRPGRFELADGGTLLLDEVSEMPLAVQAKLLRVLEEQEFERVGGSRTMRVDVRVLATTNRDLAREAARGAFRQDLYYRLNAVHLRLPPLRQRRGDVAVLAQHFFQCFRQEAGMSLRGLAPRTLQLLTAADWPGNVRQLRNSVRRACLLARGPEVRPEDLPPPEAPGVPVAAPSRTLAEVEKLCILEALREVGGNKTAAAQRLGVTTRTLLNKLTRYRQAGAA